MVSLSKEILLEALSYNTTLAILDPEDSKAIDNIEKLVHIARTKGATDEELREIGKKGIGVAEFIASMGKP